MIQWDKENNFVFKQSGSQKVKIICRSSENTLYTANVAKKYLQLGNSKKRKILPLEGKAKSF